MDGTTTLRRMSELAEGPGTPRGRKSLHPVSAPEAPAPTRGPGDAGMPPEVVADRAACPAAFAHPPADPPCIADVSPSCLRAPGAADASPTRSGRPSPRGRRRA